MGDAHEPIKIGDIGNYYGGLMLMREDGVDYWCIEDYSGFHWDICPPEVAAALRSYFMGGQPMKSEQLEELANGFATYLHNEETIQHLARRVLTAEKLVEALMVALEPFAQQADTFDSDGVEHVPDKFEPAIVGHTIGDLRRARAAYREASK